MKINQAPTQSGSFGLTKQMKEAVEKHKTTQDKEDEPENDYGFTKHRMPMAETDDLDTSNLPEDALEPSAKQEQKETSASDDPIIALGKIGVVLEDEDFQKIVFKGFLEKDVVVMPSIKGSKPLIARFRTLTGSEVDAADELLAEEIESTKMTNDGYHMRRSMWILAYGIVKLNDRPVSETVYVSKINPETKKKEQVSDVKATLKRRRAVLAALNPAILAKAMTLHGIFTANINLIIQNPDADYLKK